MTSILLRPIVEGAVYDWKLKNHCRPASRTRFHQPSANLSESDASPCCYLPHCKQCCEMCRTQNCTTLVLQMLMTKSTRRHTANHVGCSIPTPGTFVYRHVHHTRKRPASRQRKRDGPARIQHWKPVRTQPLQGKWARHVTGQ